MKTIRNGKRVARGRFTKISVLVLAATAAGACDSLLQVELPGNLTEDGLLIPDMANTMVVSAIADFECSYSDFSVSIGGLEDAYWESTGWFTRAWSEYRITSTSGNCGQSNTNAGFATSFQKARFQAEQAYSSISGFEESVADQERLLATAALYAGLVYTVFGEHWCENTVDVGPLMTPSQLLAGGEEWLGTAIGHISGDFDITAVTSSARQLAYLARARNRLSQGNLAGAAADAAQVTDPNFIAWVTRDNSVRKRWNQVYHMLNENKYGTITPPVMVDGVEVAPGFRNLTIAADGTQTVDDGMPDPRVPVENTGQVGQDGVTPHWVQTKYRDQGYDIPLADWAEAQLILAEAEFQGGDAASALGRINALRDRHGLPHASTVDMDVIVEERRREMFLEGRHHADKLRYGLWFPRGQNFNHKGVAYGPTTCLPIDETELELNPNTSG